MYVIHDYEKINTKKIICLEKHYISEKYRVQKIQYQNIII